MNNAIAFKHQENPEVEAAFIDLLDKHCHQEGAVKPLSDSLFDRIELLKATAEQVRQHQGCLAT